MFPEFNCQIFSSPPYKFLKYFRALMNILFQLQERQMLSLVSVLLPKLVKSSAEKSSSKCDSQNLIDVAADLKNDRHLSTSAKERHLSTGDYIDATLLSQNKSRSSLSHLSRGEIAQVCFICVTNFTCLKIPFMYYSMIA